MREEPTAFVLRGDYITLDALLKAAGLTGSGGQAKLTITSGAVRVDGEVELRRGAKLRPGQVVTLGDAAVRIVAGTEIQSPDTDAQNQSP